MKVVWTRRYLAELRTIGDYIAERNPRAAARLVKEIHGRTEVLLSSNPFIGRPGEIEGTRELVVSGTRYIVAYRIRDNHVEVLFVQHGAREWPDDV
ncbi:type II toxin-antitoxin system RelE/ParE family toxin [Pseudorhizobium endolithicum]|uniref:Type II toxin-antitoxin system RelE/ParE family toxin n=1 Tax=Pseudorhizobium endolithicum TaxID=1191678 RepID=A0ABM8PNW9_9HYPH|nr:type II toxin-antitoxin system RelE/ParE family toxin [Pseudorhizobium endolithicum]CAD7040078.1 type II toxin-antitoxin system RelE/ParE family toxin [Pseudorhizobium endolithicum]